MPFALPENRKKDCCHGGVLAAWAINPSKSISCFEITVGNLEGNSSEYAPLNLTLMAPGLSTPVAHQWMSLLQYLQLYGGQEKNKFSVSNSS